MTNEVFSISTIFKKKRKTITERKIVTLFACFLRDFENLYIYVSKKLAIDWEAKNE